MFRVQEGNFQTIKNIFSSNCLDMLKCSTKYIHDTLNQATKTGRKKKLTWGVKPTPAQIDLSTRAMYWNRNIVIGIGTIRNSS